MRFLRGIAPNKFEDYYIEVNRVVLPAMRAGALRSKGIPTGTPFWLATMMNKHHIYDIMAALVRACKRYE